MQNKKNYIIHMIGNAHIDPVWLWCWPEGAETIRTTFQSATELIEEHPEFIFTASSPAFYQWIEEVDKILLNKIGEKIKEGKWCLVGGWWIEPDCNIPSGEALVRQGLYGQRYFLKKFGKKAKVGYNPDSFGHNIMIPQILKKMGIDYYIFMRPGPHEKELPEDIFWWESPDGSKVLTYRIPLSYASEKKDLKEHIKRVAENFKSSLKTMMCFYGAGDHGGGPTKENIESIKNLSEQSLKDSKILFSSPDIFFKEILNKSSNLPIVKDELQHHASGCYSALSWIKKSNRKLENLLLAAEKFSVLANYFNTKIYPQRQLTRAWQLLLFTQFHDILAGTSIPEAYQEVKAMYGEVENITKEIINISLQSIGSEIDTQGEGKAVLIFNPSFRERKIPVEIEYQWPDKKIAVLDKDNNPVLSQTIRTSATIGEGRKRICFIAEVPSFGYTTYRLIPQSFDVPSNRNLSTTSHSLENDWLYLEIDPETGYFKRIYDKKNHKEVLKGPAAVPIVIKDLSDTWSHNVFKFKEKIGKFIRTTIKIVEKGPVRGRIRIKSIFKNSTLIQDVILYRELNIIECRVTINWQEKQCVLKLSFPVNVNNPEVTYQIPYGFIKRPPNGDEEPGGTWIDVSDENYGLCLINNAKYSYDVEGSDLRLTVLRSPVYAHHRPKILENNIDYQYIDQGEQTFTYILIPHKDGWRKTSSLDWAENLNNPCYPSVEYNHKGKFPKKQSFFKINKENTLVTVLKKAEKTDDFILRLYETEGKSTQVEIKLFERICKIKVGACEIKTLLIPKNKEISIQEVNLLELFEKG